jgi:hypothetical protein
VDAALVVCKGALGARATLTEEATMASGKALTPPPWPPLADVPLHIQLHPTTLDHRSGGCRFRGHEPTTMFPLS